jgi:hypothetical protein
MDIAGGVALLRESATPSTQALRSCEPNPSGSGGSMREKPITTKLAAVAGEAQAQKTGPEQRWSGRSSWAWLARVFFSSSTGEDFICVECGTQVITNRLEA